MAKKNNIVRDQKKEILKLSQISLWVDNYDDFFSDFDPRPYSQRTLSDDFVSEARKSSKETKKGNIELKLLVPKDIRNRAKERVIRRRLREYFKKRHEFLDKKRKEVIKQGSFFISLGVILMFFTTFVLFKYWQVDFFLTFLSVIAEPAGWFLFWEGLNLVIFDVKEKGPELEFNQKMSKSVITFLSY